MQQPYRIAEIAVEELDSSLAGCVHAVWEETTRRLGLRSSPRAVLAELRAFWRKQTDRLLLVAFSPDGEPVGFRFGHALVDRAEERVFYDQNGGVVPASRRNGIGRALLREQHRRARSRGYARIRTAVALDLRPMIILDLMEGFEITGIETVRGAGWSTNALIFEKAL